jgi:hypothetical protein
VIEQRNPRFGNGASRHRLKPIINIRSFPTKKFAHGSNKNERADLSCRGDASEMTNMRTLAIALAATTAVAFGAMAQSQTQTQTTTPAAQSQTTTSAPAASTAAPSGTAATTRSGVNIRANIGTGSNRAVVRTRSGGPSVVYSRSRSRYVTTVDERPSRVTVIKKKKYAKKKKRTRIYATSPSRTTTIIERRRPSYVVRDGVRTRVISRDSGVRARIGVSTSPRSTTGSATTTTTTPAGSVTGSGSAGTSKPAATGTTGTSTTTAPAQSR